MKTLPRLVPEAVAVTVDVPALGVSAAFVKVTVTPFAVSP
jgi:hypothetical protein